LRHQTARNLRIPQFGQDGIKEFYEKCPKGMVVDHIIPLQGKLISGLHVIWNLQYLTPHDNLKKGNRF
jgi:5-methylcytosine-specific restriction endonuclease McrA